MVPAPWPAGRGGLTGPRARAPGWCPPRNASSTSASRRSSTGAPPGSEVRPWGGGSRSASRPSGGHDGDGRDEDDRQDGDEDHDLHGGPEPTGPPTGPRQAGLSPIRVAGRSYLRRMTPPPPLRPTTPHCSSTPCSRCARWSSARSAWSSGCSSPCFPGATCCSRARGVAKTLAADTLATVVGGTFARVQFTPDLLLLGHHRHPCLPGLDRGVRRRAGPGVRQPAGRRDQPGAGQGAVGAAGGDGRAAGDHRRPDLPGAGAVPGGGDAEPGRVRGRVPAARGPARPVPAQGGRRAPSPPRSWRSSGAWGRPRRRSSGWRSRTSPASRTPPAGPCTWTRASCNTPSTWSRPPGTRPATDWLGHLPPTWTAGCRPGHARPGGRGPALALLRRRSFALPQDVYDVAPEVLAHRLGVTYDAGRRVEPGHLLARILASVPAPASPPPRTPRPGRCPAPGPATEARPAPPPPAPAWCGRHERGPRPPAPSPAEAVRRSSSRSPGASTACCTATTPGGSPGSAPRPARAAATPPGTTPGGSTGT